MTKLKFLVTSFVIILIVTIYVDALEGITHSGNPLDTLPGEADASVGSIFSMLGTFVNIITFNIDGAPWFISIVFWVLAVGVIYIIIDVLKDLIPFT